jgi:crotonobetaine/carnitine-CoA ligase
MTDDPRIPPPEDCILPLLLARHAAAMPDRTFAVFADGEIWSYAATRRRALAMAAGLAAVGIERGDPVLIWLPNGRLALASWFGANHLGAVSIATSDYSSEILERPLKSSTKIDTWSNGQTEGQINPLKTLKRAM